MSARSEHLAHQRESLKLRSASQRAELARTIGSIQYRLSGIDRGVSTLRRIGAKPIVIGAGIAVLALIGPKRMFRWVGRGALAAGTARRLLKQLR
jgi:uncharacterized protein YjeT (DUF2065 family)